MIPRSRVITAALVTVLLGPVTAGRADAQVLADAVARAFTDATSAALSRSARDADARTTAPVTVPASASTAPPAQEEQHPPPAETGVRAFFKTTGADFAAFPKRTSTWVILGVGGVGAALAHPIDDDVNARLVGSGDWGKFWAPGKWVGSAYVQAGTAVGLYLIGRYVMPHAEGAPKTNKVSHLGFDLLRAQIVTQTFVHGIKYAVRRDRPTGECCAFPSGHSASAFALASVLERHLGYRAAWPTIAIATYIATSRLHDNRHVLSDVVFGAALGTATGWTVVGRHGRSEYALVPVPVRGGIAVSLVRTDGNTPR